MSSEKTTGLPIPDKKIPPAVMLIGTFEIAASLLGLIVVVLVGQLDANIITLLILVTIYGALGAGLWAIQEWARYVNVVLHVLLVPYIFITWFFWEGETVWQPIGQLVITIAVVVALTRPHIRHKFQTVVAKKSIEKHS